MTTLVLKEIRDVADGTRLYVFEKPAGFSYRAGQYTAIKLENLIEPDEKSGVRSFSFASAPSDDEISFAMREGESGFKKTFWALTPGATIGVTKPVGFFTVDDNDTRPVVFLAGGIGITPVRSILREATASGSEREFVLFYANRFEKDAAFLEEVRALPVKNLKVITVYSKSQVACADCNDERGYVTPEMLKKYIGGEAGGKVYYVVGSPEFSDAMMAVLDQMGVPKEDRKSDPFTGLRKSSGESK